MKPTDFSIHVTSFLTHYLAAQRNLSPNTIKAYRDVFTLLLRFCRDVQDIAPEKLRLEQIDVSLVEAFLDHLETERKSSPRTRNHRLATLHAFFRYVQAEDPPHMLHCQKILAIPLRRHAHPTPRRSLQSAGMRPVRRAFQCCDGQPVRAGRRASGFPGVGETANRLTEWPSGGCRRADATSAEIAVGILFTLYREPRKARCRGTYEDDRDGAELHLSHRSHRHVIEQHAVFQSPCTRSILGDTQAAHHVGFRQEQRYTQIRDNANLVNRWTVVEERVIARVNHNQRRSRCHHVLGQRVRKWNDP